MFHIVHKRLKEDAIDLKIENENNKDFSLRVKTIESIDKEYINATIKSFPKRLREVIRRYTGKDGNGHAGTDRRTQARRTVMGKTGTYGEDGQLWKRRALMEKTDTYGKDGHLWKRRMWVSSWEICLSMRQISLRERVKIA